MTGAAVLRARHHVWMQTDVLAVLSALGPRDVRATFALAVSEPTPWERDSTLDTRYVDQLLREARDQALVAGEVHEGDGSVHHWQIGVTVAGLRAIGEWPPSGGEFLPGPWDEATWGQIDRPVLQEMADAPPYHGFVFRPSFGDPEEEHARWAAICRLRSAGLLGGDFQMGGLDGVRVTIAGKRALDGAGDPIERAQVELARGAKVEALNVAVEEVLAPLLRELRPADAGRLSTLNEGLKRDGVLAEHERAEIAWCLALRNTTHHGRAATVSEHQIERAIHAIAEMRETLGQRTVNAG